MWSLVTHSSIVDKEKYSGPLTLFFYDYTTDDYNNSLYF